MKVSKMYPFKFLTKEQVKIITQHGWLVVPSEEIVPYEKNKVHIFGYGLRYPRRLGSFTNFDDILVAIAKDKLINNG